MSATNTHATAVPKVTASLESAEYLPDIVEVADDNQGIEQECSVEDACTTHNSDVVRTDPEVRRSERSRRQAERLTYEKLGEPCARPVVVRQTSVHSVTVSHPQ